MKQLDTARNSTAAGAIVAALAYWLLASTAPERRSFLVDIRKQSARRRLVTSRFER
jgi:hypothetical protein